VLVALPFQGADDTILNLLGVAGGGPGGPGREEQGKDEQTLHGWCMKMERPLRKVSRPKPPGR
jgi:hypothetical protein